MALPFFINSTIFSIGCFHLETFTYCYYYLLVDTAKNVRILFVIINSLRLEVMARIQNLGGKFQYHNI